MKTVCIYHAECIDGAAAAAVVKYKYPDAELLPANHGDPVPGNLAGKRVFIVDFSYSPPLLQKIREEAGEIHWFDHHKTAIPTRATVGFGVVDLEESGATLAWKQLFPGKDVPKILLYVKDKDLWRWELPDSREISADIRETEGIMDPSHPAWKHFLEGIEEAEWKAMIARGRHRRRLLKDYLKKASKKGFEVEIEGHKVLAVNWTGDSSELGEFIYKELGYTAALIFSYSGKEWTFSLRSNKIDVSEISAKRGGGGHRGAAGFRTEDIEWLMKRKIP